MPVLQFLRPEDLAIDPAYQRAIDTGPSQTLIRKIAQYWNWDLCQPLVVAVRPDGALMVIDGQHRLEAARLRGDIAQLPCVVVHYATAADEAASFVHLNQQRRPLSKLDVFKAAVASGDPESIAIAAAVEASGLSIAPHTNCNHWKPGMVANIGSIEVAWRRHGATATSAAMRVLAMAYPAEVLRYAGTIFSGIVAVCDAARETLDEDRLAALIGAKPQLHWRGAMMAARADDPLLRFGDASAKILLDAWRVATGVPDAEPIATIAKSKFAQSGNAWCDQCEMRVTVAQAERCRSRFCSFRRAA